MGDLGSIFGLALLAMFNPTLLAAVTVMMLLPETKKLMFGYLLGAYLTSISLGLLIVFTLNGSASVESARHTLNPAEDFVIGAILVVVGMVLKTGRAERAHERRRKRKEEKQDGKQSLPERLLGRGSARVTFAVGAMLTLPGVSYLTALDRIAKLDWAPTTTVVLVVVFCLFQQLLLELPLVGYALAPDWTQRAVAGFREWLARNGRRAAANVAVILGALLLVRGLVTL
ncbi:MAG TPA: GAP family protein [Solirubrobacterales bacterium]|nr:GAP family protein [Solirubrobacterales bacterium]